MGNRSADAQSCWVLCAPEAWLAELQADHLSEAQRTYLQQQWARCSIVLNRAENLAECKGPYLAELKQQYIFIGQAVARCADSAGPCGAYEGMPCKPGYIRDNIVTSIPVHLHFPFQMSSSKRLLTLKKTLEAEMQSQL